MTEQQRTALVTGASRGFGLALSTALAGNGWSLIIDARGEHDLAVATAELGASTVITGIAGDVTDPAHRADLLEAAQARGGLDLLVNNASTLGPSPRPDLAGYPLEDLRRVFEVNVLAPLALIQAALPLLREKRGIVVNVTSDAATEPYPGWGGYGSSKAALNQLSQILSEEEPEVSVYWYDPGDMNTAMHQKAFPGEDISDRPPPEDSVPTLIDLIAARRPSGWYRAHSEVGVA